VLEPRTVCAPDAVAVWRLRLGVAVAWRSVRAGSARFRRRCRRHRRRRRRRRRDPPRRHVRADRRRRRRPRCHAMAVHRSGRASFFFSFCRLRFGAGHVAVPFPFFFLLLSRRHNTEKVPYFRVRHLHILYILFIGIKIVSREVAATTPPSILPPHDRRDLGMAKEKCLGWCRCCAPRAARTRPRSAWYCRKMFARRKPNQ